MVGVEHEMIFYFSIAFLDTVVTGWTSLDYFLGLGLFEKSWNSAWNVIKKKSWITCLESMEKELTFLLTSTHIHVIGMSWDWRLKDGPSGFTTANL